MEVLLVLLIGVGLVYVLSRFNNDTRADVEREFANTTLTSSDPRFAFHGTTAVVLHTFEHKDNGVFQGVHRICKNEHGEYFLFVSNGKRPYVTHLSKERAKNALRSDREAFIREFGSQDA